jgi:DNA-binding NarL/FixJ family response regulator
MQAKTEIITIIKSMKRSKGCSIRVLIVDDNPHSRKGLCALLSTQIKLCAIIEAKNGLEAIDAVEHHPLDLIVMDLQMPEMNGTDAIRQIKQSHPHLPVLALTLYPDYREEAMEAGADSFLVKGCSSDELLHTIMTLAMDPKQVI